MQERQGEGGWRKVLFENMIRGKIYVSSLPFYPKEVMLPGEMEFEPNEHKSVWIRVDEFLGYWTNNHPLTKINSGEEFVVQAAGDLPEYECEVLETKIGFKLPRSGGILWERDLLDF